jgi:hypothetical protein
VFFDTPHGLATSLRMRGYGTVPEEVADADEVAIGKLYLEHKAEGVKTRSAGTVVLGNVEINGLTHTPHALRVARRQHHTLGDPDDESRRITVDHGRRVFAIDHGTTLRYLGDLGPRIEIKSPDVDEVSRAVFAHSLDSKGYELPHRSQELYLEDILRRLIPINTYSSLPEIEKKYEILQGSGALGNMLNDFVAEHDDLETVLPVGSTYSRMRRCHVCKPQDDAVVTVMETPSGRLSTKLKQNAVVTPEGLLLRDTEASLTTNTTGSRLALPDYLAASGLKKAVSFTKLQQKVPFTIKGSGIALHISHDVCLPQEDSLEPLEQIEMEFIGSTGDSPEQKAAEDAMNRIGDDLEEWLRQKHIVIANTTLDKAGFFLNQ